MSTWIRCKSGRTAIMVQPNQIVTMEDQGDFKVRFGLPTGALVQWDGDKTVQGFGALMKALGFGGSA